MKKNFNEKIVGLSIPDSDIKGWMQELRQSKLTQAEIDDFLANLNLTYANKLMTRATKVENELKGSVEYLEDKYGHQITPEAEDCLRQMIDKMLSVHENKINIDRGEELKLEDGDYEHERG